MISRADLLGPSYIKKIHQDRITNTFNVATIHSDEYLFILKWNYLRKGYNTLFLIRTDFFFTFLKIAP